eukprot:COSAG02_NODE_8767_length_2451_cov_2.720663_1_plen_332_part_00
MRHLPAYDMSQQAHHHQQHQHHQHQAQDKPLVGIRLVDPAQQPKPMTIAAAAHHVREQLGLSELALPALIEAGRLQLGLSPVDNSLPFKQRLAQICHKLGIQTYWEPTVLTTSPTQDISEVSAHGATSHIAMKEEDARGIAPGQGHAQIVGAASTTQPPADRSSPEVRRPRREAPVTQRSLEVATTRPLAPREAPGKQHSRGSAHGATSHIAMKEEDARGIAPGQGHAQIVDKEVVTITEEAAAHMAAQETAAARVAEWEQAARVEAEKKQARIVAEREAASAAAEEKAAEEKAAAAAAAAAAVRAEAEEVEAATRIATEKESEAGEAAED